MGVHHLQFPFASRFPKLRYLMKENRLENGWQLNRTVTAIPIVHVDASGIIVACNSPFFSVGSWT